MKTDNELIAEFMGLDVDGKNVTDGDQETTINNLRYDTSWDWLMPVVDKITNIWATTTNRKKLKECTPIFRAIQNRLGLIEISGVYELSVEFIKWYNANK